MYIEVLNAHVCWKSGKYFSVVVWYSPFCKLYGSVLLLDAGRAPLRCVERSGARDSLLPYGETTFPLAGE